MSATLEHATVVEIDRRGVLVRGQSGSGKTLLALELLSRCRAAGIASALVADDYVYLSHHEASGSLRASVPDGIEGRVELRGFGIAALGDTRWKPQTDVALVVSLVPPARAERVADPERRAVFEGVALPELACPERQPLSAAYAVFGWLGLAPRLI
ncbi:MAG: serine kinase [Ahrensia sp.]|nr:serine kinase [Ahrensia sp.]